jgi:phosphosulfolactate phosphohydrolase-like enzyme
MARLLTPLACIAGLLLAASLVNAVAVVAKARTLAARPQMVAVGHSLKLGGCDSTYRCGGRR